MKLRNKEKTILTRKYIITNMLFMVLAGLLVTPAILSAFRMVNVEVYKGYSIIIIIYILMCLFFWIPTTIPMNQIVEVNDETVSIIPRYSSLKQLKIAWYVLICNNAKPFYRMIHLNDIQKVTFTFDAHWGAYAYQRFSFVIKLKLEGETIKLFLNPQQNGPLLPSGNGSPLASKFSNEDMVNLIEHFKANGVEVNDPYKLVGALKDKDIVLYDYLVSLKKNILF